MKTFKEFTTKINESPFPPNSSTEHLEPKERAKLEKISKALNAKPFGIHSGSAVPGGGHMAMFHYPSKPLFQLGAKLQKSEFQTTMKILAKISRVDFRWIQFTERGVNVGL